MAAIGPGMRPGAARAASSRLDRCVRTWAALAALATATARPALADPDDDLSDWSHSGHASYATYASTSVSRRATPARAEHRGLSLELTGAAFVALGATEYLGRFGLALPTRDFRVGGDGYFGADTYAGGEDKLGHAWDTMILARASSRALRAGGWRPGAAAALGAGLAWSFMLAHELEDGVDCSFSPGDIMGNTAGALFGVATELSPGLDRLLDYRLQYWPSAGYLAGLQQPHAARDRLPFEDYGGQTYLLALHALALPGVDPQGAWWAKSLDLVVGFHIENPRPEATPPMSGVVTTQHLFVGVSLNLQGLFDQLSPGSTAHAIGHGLAEVVNVPFTTLPLLETSRSYQP